MTNAPRSRISRYWYVWLGIVALALLLRFTVFVHASDNHRFLLGVAYMVATWLPIGLLNWIESERLMAYLEEHHYDKWEELTYIPGFGNGWGYNGFRIRRWLYSSEGLADPVLATIKQDQRALIRFTLTVFFSYLVIVPLFVA